MAVLNYRACSWALAALSLAACELTRDPMAIPLTEDRVSVHSVLMAGDSMARVLLTLVPATSDPFNPFAMPEWIPVTDAEVRLSRGTDTVVLMVGSDTTVNPCFGGPMYNQSPARDFRTGCYTARVPGGIASGAEFELLIDLPGRGRVHGHTIVPAAPTILEPRPDTILPKAPGESPNFQVQWTDVHAGRAAELRFAARNTNCVAYLWADGIFGYAQWRVVVDESSADVGAYIQCPEPVERVPVDIVLTAFDAAYSRYLEVYEQNGPMSDAALGFTGPAIGVFGSAASARQPVWFE